MPQIVASDLIFCHLTQIIIVSSSATAHTFEVNLFFTFFSTHFLLLLSSILPFSPLGDAIFQFPVYPVIRRSRENVSKEMKKVEKEWKREKKVESKASSKESSAGFDDLTDLAG